MSNLNLPWKAVEHSWQYTTIYDSAENVICLFDLEDMPGLTEETQEACEEIQRARVQAVLEAINATGSR